MADAAQRKKQKTTNGSDAKNGTSNAKSSTAMPETYPWIDEMRSSQERIYTLVDDVITDCKSCELEDGFTRYIDEELGMGEATWRAVWSSRDLGCDVLVMVKAMRYPDATVDIVEPFGCELNSYAELAGGDGQQLKTKEDVMKYLTSKSSKVPLMEICPVNEEPSYAEDVDDDDRDVDMDHIADGLELYRFFYTYIYRVLYDERFGGDYDFSNVHLHPRMKLHYDVQNKNTTKAIMKSYTEIMAEYPKKSWLFSKIRNTYSYPNHDEELPKVGNEIIDLENTLEKLADKNYKRK